MDMTHLAAHRPLVIGATDGSQPAQTALQTGLSLIDATAVELRLVTVIPTLDAAFVTPADALAPMSSGAEFARYESILRERGEQLLAEAAANLSFPASRQVVLAGSPGPALRDYADEEGADLIIVGSQGLGAVDRVLLGSVSDFLSRKAHCPVLVVPAGAGGTGPGPVVIATDGSAHAQRAATRVVPLLAPGTALTVVTVTEEPPSQPIDAITMLAQRTTEGHGVELDTAVADRLGREDVDTAVLHGDPAKALLEYAAAAGARALVMGTRGHGGLSRAVLGSVVHTVLLNTNCPVFVVGPRA